MNLSYFSFLCIPFVYLWDIWSLLAHSTKNFEPSFFRLLFKIISQVFLFLIKFFLDLSLCFVQTHGIFDRLSLFRSKGLGWFLFLADIFCCFLICQFFDFFCQFINLGLFFLHFLLFLVNGLNIWVSFLFLAQFKLFGQLIWSRQSKLASKLERFLFLFFFGR